MYVCGGKRSSLLAAGVLGDTLSPSLTAFLDSSPGRWSLMAVWTSWLVMVCFCCSGPGGTPQGNEAALNLKMVGQSFQD